MRIFWPVTMTNERVRELAEMDKISTVYKKSEKVEMDWACAAIPTRQACKNSTNLDTIGKGKDQRRHYEAPFYYLFSIS